MSADKSRITHDHTRKYREVVRQQGRVTLDADENEAQHLSSEETRLNALDFVGPSGSPDLGFQVSNFTGIDFEIAAGSMYVGGLRLTTDNTTYNTQPEWFDRMDGTAWNVDKQPNLEELIRKQNALAILVLREQEITATEDPALREVALGGPDSAARTRILQRVVAFGTDANLCSQTPSTIGSFWKAKGLQYNFRTAALESQARLLVTLVSDPPPKTPCDPPAGSGYLGADNQLIRVQIASFDPGKRKGTLLWGYNNASVLYRCDLAPDKSAVVLRNRPIAPEFEPAANQVVQLLLPAARLDPYEDAFAAEISGWSSIVTQPYDGKSGRVPLPDPALVPPIATNLQTPQGTEFITAPLFLRLWEGQLEFALETPVTLPGTGLAVTLSSQDPGQPLHTGDYWSFAARPFTRDKVYSERFTEAPQPPTGPRMWAAPLAVIPKDTSTAPSDCRPHFDNLVELTGRKGDCCCIKIGPQSAPVLQQIIDQAVKAHQPMPVTVHLEPGEYHLAAPLVLDLRHRGLVLEACTPRTAVIVGTGGSHDLAHGLIQILGGHDISIRGLRFGLSPVRFSKDVANRAKRFAATTAGAPAPADVGCIGIYCAQCSGVSIDNCAFAIPADREGFISGIALGATCIDIHISSSKFSGHSREANASMGIATFPMLSGIHRFPVHVIDLRVRDNEFSGIAAAIVLNGDAELAHVSGNVARNVSIGLMVQWPARPTGKGGRGTRGGPASNKEVLEPQLFMLAHAVAPGLAPHLAAELSTIADVGEVTKPALLTTQNLGLTVLGNQFEALLGNSYCVLVVNRSTRFASAQIGGNSFWNQGRFPTVGIQGVAVELTGNIVGNGLPSEFPKNKPLGRAALVIDPPEIAPGSDRPISLAAVTGNTFLGSTNLATLSRSGVPAPMNNWAFFNTIVE